MDIDSLAFKAEHQLQKEFKEIDELEYYFSKKILEAFHNNNVTEADFSATTGYGYNDIGRDKIEDIFKEVLHAEDAIVRSQFISGTHALTVALFGLLRPNDLFLSITSKPYDTLDEVIGIKENNSSLKAYGIKYDQIDLIDNDFDYDKIGKYLSNNKVKVIEIQRSKGYSTRDSLILDKLEKVIKYIKDIDKDIIILVDNCYCEFVEKKSPLEVGADIIVGSLIKNLGGGIAPNGAYIAGKKELVELCSERLTVPGQGKEVGPTLGINKQILQGLYMAPLAVASSLKTITLASYMLENLGYHTSPRYDQKKADIVLNITFNDKDKLIKFTQGIQKMSAIDANAYIKESDMPGYDDKIIMASGSFVQGSSIELSCDGPLREPYIAYLQGSLTYNYGKLGVINAIKNI